MLAGVQRPLLRIAARIPMLLAMSIVVFVTLRVLPADPLGMLLPPNATPADVAAVSAALGLDRPLYVQYGVWLQDVLRGDWGRSIQSGIPVRDLVLHALPTTLQLVFAGLTGGIVLGVALALVAFRRRGTFMERLIDGYNSLSLAVPEFLWGILLILVIGIGTGWLPFLGTLDPGMSVPRLTGFLLLDALLAGDLPAFASAARHLALPALAMTLGIAPPIMRVLRASLHEVYAEDYIGAARLRGVPERQLLWRWALRNAALPTVSLIGLQAGVIVGGTLLIETIFGLPGIGALMVGAITNLDLPVIQALAITYAIAVQVMSVVTDLVLAWLNPRLRA
ncbi:ABC transporter permease [Verticiella sediminum]|uniref:ABC transporter permease n=1 Tax=Verticiella sediminum TaxID=1247510 RepID=A0A556AW72_9BURK|nr:ABC transporter permease [Verticiella sediminum]